MPVVDQRQPMGLSLRKAAIELDLCENSLRKAIKEGKIHAVRIGRRVIIPRASLEKFLTGGK
jgi:excisionase family DNA binding protein